MKIWKRLVIIESILLIVIIPFTFMLYYRYDYTKQVVYNLVNLIISKFNEIAKLINKICAELKSIYPSFMDVFTNRELAIAFLILVLGVYLISMKRTRQNLIDIIKMFFSKQFVRLNLVLVVYMVAMLIILIKINFWELALIKITIIWFFSTGIVSTYKAINRAKDFNYFKGIIKDNLKIAIVVQFVTNLYSFSFGEEVFFLLVIIFLSMIVGFIETNTRFNKNNYKKMQNIIYSIIAAISIYWLYNSIRLLINDLPNRDKSLLIKEFIFPTISSISFIIVMYFIVIYSMYKIMFVRLGFKKTINDNIRKYLKYKIIFCCNINIVKIQNFTLESDIFTTYINTKQDVKQVIKSYKLL
ncbi:hypothetical protein AN1V17_42150 [Vallitalea sediminicola]